MNMVWISLRQCMFQALIVYKVLVIALEIVVLNVIIKCARSIISCKMQLLKFKNTSNVDRHLI